MNVQRKNIVWSTALTLIFSLTACNGDGLKSGEPVNVSLSMSDSRVAQNGINLQNLLFTKAYAANAGDIKFCFKRLRFKLPEGVLIDDSSGDSSTDGTASSNGLEDNIDFELGQVSIDPSGTDLGDLTLPKGEYVRIEFDLENDCAGGSSAEVSNINGSYSSQDKITIRYDGLFTVEEGAQIDLPLAEIVDALDSFQTTSTLQEDKSRDLRNMLESLSIRVSND